MESKTLCPECFHALPAPAVRGLKLAHGPGPSLAHRCPEFVEAEESVSGLPGPCWCANEYHRA